MMMRFSTRESCSRRAAAAPVAKPPSLYLTLLPPDGVRALELLTDLRMHLARVRQHVLDAGLDRLVDQVADRPFA